MKKIVKLTESDLMNIIKRVINESVPMSKAKSPCPGQVVCFGSVNTPIGCCPVGYTCAGGGCTIRGTSSLKVMNSTPTLKEAKDKRKCECPAGHTMIDDLPCTCSIPMTPITK